MLSIALRILRAHNFTRDYSVRTLKHGGFRVKAGAPRSGDLFLFNFNSNFLCLE